MAKSPVPKAGNKLLNIMNYMRGNIELPDSAPTSDTKAYARRELVSSRKRSKLLQDSTRVAESGNHRPLTQAAILNVVRTSLVSVSKTRIENRKILRLMPNVEKAARLMIATTMSPNELTREAVRVTFDGFESINPTQSKYLNEMATEFFQDKLNLLSSIPSWIYQAGYEAGAAVFAIVPLQSFKKLTDSDFEGTESFISKVVEPTVHQSIFGFGDSNDLSSQKSDIAGLESFGSDFAISFAKANANADHTPPRPADNAAMRAFVNSVIGTESLALTDNPSVLQLPTEAKEHRAKRTRAILDSRYRTSVKPEERPIESISASREGKPGDPEDSGVFGNPIFMRLPPESVTVIHTPGDPSDHQGYLVILDQFGNPVDVVTEQSNMPLGQANYNQVQSDVFSQVYSAYGFNNARGMARLTQEETMGEIYNHIVTKHLQKRMEKAGFIDSELSNTDGIMRCMFARYLQRKMTRVLFLPKDLVTYFAFELDEHGYGVSRLEKIKFSLGMKMAIQVSRAMAAVKAAMDRRKVEVKFTEDMMDDPESVFNTIIQEYLRKSLFEFSADPNVIQSQIADKSLSIKAIDIPGMETFDLSNEADTRTGSFDFDPTMSEQLDKEINNGLRVPPAAMNALSEDEYSRSVSTTNLFFAMDVSIDQDIVKKHSGDLVRKYALYSEEFREKIFEIVPELRTMGKKTIDENSSIETIVDDTGDTEKSQKNQGSDLPDDYTLDTLIESMQINLPKPDVAPSKAQFEVLDAMVTSITATVSALFPDDLMGPNDELAAAVRVLRARFISTNIRAFMDSSGMSSIDVPDSDFAKYYAESNNYLDGIANFSELLKDHSKVSGASEGADTSAFDAPVSGGEESSPLDGYQ